ncbi:universal stress protein [Amycolatopsis anabasis]|uniref:universal stress protein n=1 Tax=Amycolatopsis anabasis TaxID=1840409 RepID=UPI00131EB221|nr:universal stress protein [Amycolatopsis anabasis]
MNQAIVAAVDGSVTSTRALRWAAEFAASRNLPLHIVHAFGLIGSYYGAGLPAPQEVFDALEQESKDILREAAEAARTVSDQLTVTTSMPVQPPIPLLLELSRSARMVVLGSSGRGGFAGMRIGSTAIAVASHARCPVAVIRGDEAGSGPVVVGVDGSSVSERAIAVAFEEASWRGAPLAAVHAWSDLDWESAYGTSRLFVDWDTLAADEERLLAQRLAGWQEKYPEVPVERVVVRDNPRHQLLQWSEKARLVVTGSRGRGGFRGLLLGSTGQALIQHAACPVLIVHPERAE